MIGSTSQRGFMVIPPVCWKLCWQPLKLSAHPCLILSHLLRLNILVHLTCSMMSSCWFMSNNAMRVPARFCTVQCLEGCVDSHRVAQAAWRHPSASECFSETRTSKECSGNRFAGETGLAQALRPWTTHLEEANYVWLMGGFGVFL